MCVYFWTLYSFPLICALGFAGSLLISEFKAEEVESECHWVWGTRGSELEIKEMFARQLDA